MDLLKLIEELRTYRAQVEEAIASMEELARRRGLPDRDRQRSPKAVRTRAKNAGKQTRVKHPRPKLVKKRGRPPGKRKSA